MDKFAIFYQVITENTSEERVSQRRRGETKQPSSRQKSTDKSHQLELISNPTIYPVDAAGGQKAAEESSPYQE